MIRFSDYQWQAMTDHPLPLSTNSGVTRGALPQPLRDGPYFDVDRCVGAVSFRYEWNRLCDEIGPNHEEALVAASWAAVAEGVDVDTEWLPKLVQAEGILRSRPGHDLALGLNLASQGFCRWWLGDERSAVVSFESAMLAFNRAPYHVHNVDVLRVIEFHVCALRSLGRPFAGLEVLELMKDLTVGVCQVHDVALAHVELRQEIIAGLEREHPCVLARFRATLSRAPAATECRMLVGLLLSAAELHGAVGNDDQMRACIAEAVDRLLSSYHLSGGDIGGFLSHISMLLSSAGDWRRSSRVTAKLAQRRSLDRDLRDPLAGSKRDGRLS